MRPRTEWRLLVPQVGIIRSVLAVVATRVFDLRHRVTTILKVVSGSLALVNSIFEGRNLVHGWFPFAAVGPWVALVPMVMTRHRRRFFLPSAAGRTRSSLLDFQLPCNSRKHRD
jgi:hypothetical protein